MCAISVCGAQNSIVPTTTLAAVTANNTSAAANLASQSNGNAGAGNVSKVDLHSMLYGGATTKVYAHLLLWFGPSNHMNVGYSSTDPAQIHSQITDMISRGIDGVIIDWYGPNNSIDQATQLVMAEVETHPGFTFAIMIDQGAIASDSCSGCTPQQALISQLQYIEQTYFPSPAYMTWGGRPVVTNFDLDLHYTIDWNAVNSALSAQPVYWFQNNSGFTHALSDGSYAWVMPTTTDFGASYLSSFYDTGIPLANEQTVGAAYKGFNDTLASWGSNRVMSQQCGQTWLQTFSQINGLYHSGQQLPALQLVTWNDYEEATEIESGINNCTSVSASVSGNSLQWTVTGNQKTVDHYVVYISKDGQNLMPLGESYSAPAPVNLCSYGFPKGNYISFVQAVGKPSITNEISAAVNFTLNCSQDVVGGSTTLTMSTNPSSLTVASGQSQALNVSVAASGGSFNSPISLNCTGLPAGLSCSFAPGSVTPGSGTGSSVLTVAAIPVAGNRSEKRNYFLAIDVFGTGLFGLSLIGKLQRRRCIVVIGSAIVAVLLMGNISCGGYSTGSNSSVGSTHSYVVAVTGSTSTVQLSTTITVTLK